MSRLARKVWFFERMAEFLPNLKDIWSLHKRSPRDVARA